MIYSNDCCSIAGVEKSRKTKMAVREKGADINVLEKRISDLERRILTSEEDVHNLKDSSVIILISILVGSCLFGEIICL